MKAPVPALAPLLRSNAQGNLLAQLFLNPDDEFSLSDLGRLAEALPATIHREVGRLVESGVLSDRAVGRSRLVRANSEHELYGPLSDLILLTYGPRVILRPIVSALDGIEEAYIYGSWAARYDGEQGTAPRGVDVVIVGTTSQAQLLEAACTAQAALNREVNFTRVAAEQWASADEPFVKTIKARPLVRLDFPGGFS